MKKKQKKLLKKILLLINTLLYHFIITEIILRTVDYQPKNELIEVNIDIPNHPIISSKDSVLAYEFQPNYSQEGYKINSLGMRDYEYSKEKPENVFRILATGDSVTAGAEVAHINQTYPKKLELLLNNYSSEKIEVLNAGVDGYTLTQVLRYFLTKGIEIEPDLLIVNLVIENDFYVQDPKIFTDMEEGNIKYYNSNIKYFAKPNFNFILIKQSYFFRFINNEIIKILKIQKNVDEWPLGEEKFIKDIKKTKQQTEQNNITIIFVLFPTFDNKRLLNERAFIKSTLTSLDIKYLDLFDTFRQYDNHLLKAQPEDIIHPNEFGYEIAAKEIYLYLLENNLVPP